MYRLNVTKEITMQRRHMFRIAVTAVAVAALWAGTAAAQTVLKFSHTDQPGGARQKAAELFAQKVEQYTQGRYKVQVFPAGQLANDPKAVEQLQLGGIDFTVTGTGTYATHIPTLNLTALPFLVESYPQGWKLYDESKWMQAQFAKGPEKGFRFLSPFEAGFRSMTTKDPLVTPADAKGKNIVWQSKPIVGNLSRMPLNTEHGLFTGSRLGKASLAPAVAHWVRVRVVGTTPWSPWHAPFMAASLDHDSVSPATLPVPNNP